MGHILGHLFGDSCLVVKLLLVNAPIIIVQEIKDGRYEWSDFSGDGIAKGNEVFGVYSFDYYLDYGSFEEYDLDIDFFVRQCTSSVLAIWADVPDIFGTRMPGFGGRVNGLAGAMQ